MSKFNKFLTILCLSAFIFMVGCSKDDKPTPDPNNPNGNGGDGSGSYGWEFLKVGNKWQYESRYYDKYNNLIYLPSATKPCEIIKIEKSLVYPNADKIIYDDNSDKVNIFTYVNDKGLYESEFDISENNPLIQKNYYVGQKLFYTYPDGVKQTTEILSIDTSIKVPAGTFSCVKIRLTFSDSKKRYLDYYFSPKHGIIMTDEYDDAYMDDGERSVKVLFSKNF